MITVEDYLTFWKINHGDVEVDMGQLTADMRVNAETLVLRTNMLLDKFGQERGITSGWRPREVNAKVSGAALRSKHMTCQAIDLADPEGDLDEWLLNNPLVLRSVGLYQEHPSATKGWCHVQTVPPRSGNRVFYP